MDFSRATGIAVAWLVLFVILSAGALNQRLARSAPVASVAAVHERQIVDQNINRH